MHITPGEKVVIVGPSGSGKSTFLRCLNLLEQPTDGTITFDGQEITAPGVDVNKIRRRMGMVFQHFNLFANLTVKENIMLAPVQLKLKTKAEAEAEVEAEMSLTDGGTLAVATAGAVPAGTGAGTASDTAPAAAGASVDVSV